jgi:hypothetical protein
MAAIACVPAAPVAKVSACKVTVTATDENTITGYDPAKYPSSPEMRYYLAFLLGGVEHGRSYVFSTNSDGEHEFNSFIFEAAGSWTIKLADASDDSQVATQAVTVS